jgi:hypothetical protein
MHVRRTMTFSLQLILGRMLQVNPYVSLSTLGKESHYRFLDSWHKWKVLLPVYFAFRGFGLQQIHQDIVDIASLCSSPAEPLEQIGQP